MTEATDTNDPKNFGWVHLELMGHRQRVGRACEETIAGGMMLRIDVLTKDPDVTVTEYYGTQSIYAMSPITEDVARQYHVHSDPRPLRPAGFQEPRQVSNQSDEMNDDGRPF